MEEELFGITFETFGKNVTKKFNYMLLFMKDYIYTKKSFLPIL